MESEPDFLPNEAAVEQRVLVPLIQALGYGHDDIAFRHRVIFGEGRKGRPHEADIVLFSGPSKTKDTSLVVIEAKRPGSEFSSAHDQAMSYAANLRAPFLVLCDGLRLEVWRHGADLDSHRVFVADLGETGTWEDQLDLLIGKPAAIAYAASLKSLEPDPDGTAAANLTGRIRSATEASLGLLEASGRFRPAVCVARKAAFGAFAAFEMSSATILPVTGASGLGKTYALASWARDVEGGARLFLRGEAIQPGHASLGDLVRESLDLGPTPRGGAPSSALRDMVILLDGLNEHRFGTLEELRRSWLPATLQWLQAHACRLILTCRLETWALLQDAFPRGLLPGGQKADDETDGSQPEPVFRLGAFTTREARLALDAYGLDGRLSPETATYPLLLAIAAEASDQLNATASGLGALLRHFVDRKVMIAAARLGQPTWPQDIRGHLDTLAAALLASGSSWISVARASELFGRQVGALDILVEEHLLIRGEAGVRFQFDLAQEALQVRHVQVAGVLRALRWVDPLQGDLRGWFSLWKIISALVRRAVTYPQLEALPTPSLAGMALVEAAMADASTRTRILAALLPADLPVDGDLRRWRTAVTIGFIEGLRFVRVWSPDILAWFEALLGTAEHVVDDQVIDTLADALRAPAAPVEQRLELAPLLFMRESDPGWGSVQNGIPRFNQLRDDRHKPVPALSTEVRRPVSRLVEALAVRDPEVVFAALARWLNDSREPAPTGRYFPVSVSRAAAVSLLHLRGLDPVRACSIVLGGRQPAHDALLRKFARVETDTLAFVALRDALSESPDLDPDRCDQALWLCSSQAMARDLSDHVVLYWVSQLRMGSGTGRDYAARSLVCRYCWYERAFYRDPFEYNGLVHVLATLEPVIEEATGVLLDVVDRGCRDLEADDLLHLLSRDFSRAADLVERHCANPHPGLGTLAHGVMRFLSATEVRQVRTRRINPEPDRLEKARILVQSLRTAVQVGGADAAALIAPRVLEMTSGVGYNEQYYLTESEYWDLGLLDLASALLDEGDHRIDRDCVQLRWPPPGPFRDRIFTALRRRDMADEPFRDFIYDLFWDLVQWGRGSFEEILSFRSDARAESWDRAAMRWICIARSDLFDERLGALWATASPASAAGEEFMTYRALGATIRDAAGAVERLSAYGKRQFQESLRRGRR